MFCEGYKVDENGNKVSTGPGRWIQGPLRTLHSNRQNYYNWLRKYGHRSDSFALRNTPEFKNIKNWPLTLPHDEHKPLILFMGLDPLHTIKLGKIVFCSDRFIV